MKETKTIKTLVSENGVTFGTALSALIIFFWRKIDVDVMNHQAELVGILSVIFRGIQAFAQRKGWLVIALIFLIPNVSYAKDLNTRIILEEKSVPITDTLTSSVGKWYIAPSIATGVIAIDFGKRRQFEAGIDWSGCYGVFYSPEFWDKYGDSPILGLSLCIQGGILTNQSNDEAGSVHFAGTGTAVLTIARWILIGVGYRQRIALSEGGSDYGSVVAVLGLNLAVF
ncbi:MAG: hypothetical protein HC877_18960 [Thioploca sp.]|nr:hypothetical protein [Thioploca sp.]